MLGHTIWVQSFEWTWQRSQQLLGHLVLLLPICMVCILIVNIAQE